MSELLPCPCPVCQEIRHIMTVYREQEEERGYIGTPGGLEHMGDVWSKISKWENTRANRWLNFTDEELMHQNHIYEMVDTEFRCLTEYELKFWDEFKAELERRKK